jgi:hypothetical protein
MGSNAGFIQGSSDRQMPQKMTPLQACNLRDLGALSIFVCDGLIVLSCASANYFSAMKTEEHGIFHDYVVINYAFLY